MSRNWYACGVFRNLRKRWLGYLIVRNGEATRRLQRDSMESQFAGVLVEDIHAEIERRERRHDQLLAKFKEAV